MITFDALVAALGERRAASEWVATERRRLTASVRLGPAPMHRSTDRRSLSAVVHRDTGVGRGTARFVIDGDTETAADAVQRGLVSAAAAAGPAWRLAPAAAAARVQIADPALERGAAGDLAAAIATEVAAAARAVGEIAVDATEVEIVRDAVAVAASQGNVVRWRATEVTVRTQVTASGRSRDLVVSVRNRGHLELRVRLAHVRKLLEMSARAEPTPTGTIPVTLHSKVLGAARGGVGLLEAFVAQADPALERQGLTRYRPGLPVAAGAASIAEPLTLISDGTLPFGSRSAPLSEEGEPVRRFALVERGLAAGLALDGREAALRGQAPNGGIRNLVASTGTATDEELLAPPVLEILELTWVDLDPHTGELTASIDLGTLHTDRARPVTGGILRFDAIRALALARRNGDLAQHGAYLGPTLWRLPPVVVD